jgi:hypothetical protein
MLSGVTKISLGKINSPIYLRRKSSDLLTFHQIFTFKEYDMNLGFVKFVVDAKQYWFCRRCFLVTNFQE